MNDLPQDLGHTLETALCAQRDLFFVNLLSGGVYETEAEVQAAAEAVHIRFPHGIFLVLIAKKESWGALYDAGEADQKEYHFILRNALENGFPGVTQAANVLGDMTAIVNLPQLPESGLRGIVQDANHILEVLEAELDISATIAASRVYYNPLELSKGYQDARHVLEYQQLMGEDAPVTAYQQLTHPYLTPPTSSYFSTEQKLLRCMQAKDFPQLQMVLHTLIDNEFGVSKPTVDTFRFRIYGVVNLLLNLMNDLRAVVGDKVINSLNVGPRLTAAVTVADIVTEMDAILDELIRQTQQISPAAPAWTAQVRQYVHAHYKDPDTTVAAIADHFQLTPTYCSKVYREVYGVRLLEEIQRLRLDEAKRLLQGKDSIRTIAEKSGFPSPLTMSRAFKRYESALPSSFRGPDAP